MHASSTPDHILRARLPRWLLPSAWPQQGHQPALADLHLAQGRIVQVLPHGTQPAPHGTVWDVAGALVLPGLVDAHTHLDKAFTLPRMGVVQPGLLGAIEAMMVDRQSWTEADIHARASRALQWAYDAGTVHLRTHCDWWEPDAQPLAWNVLRALAHDWADRITLERVSLIPLHLYTDRSAAMQLAATVAASGAGALLGGFVHSTNWDPQALRHLFEAAQHHGLNVDLHVDEELHPGAQGLATTAALVKELRFEGHVVCGHTCALAAQDEATALATLDAVAQSPITLVTLPITNLLLQDATTGRTPRQRGLTLVKEARARGIPVLVASDNVQDPFCPVGSFDPLEALATGVLAAQLDAPFDQWSESLCRTDWLRTGRTGTTALPLQPGAVADLLVFTQADHWGFPSRTQGAQGRVVLRQGRVASGYAPAAWHVPTHVPNTASARMPRMSTASTTLPAPGIAQPLARYAAWRRAGDFIYLSGIIAVDPAASRIVRGYDDIPHEAATLIGRTGEFSSDIKEGPILAQSWYVLDRIRQTIEAAGGQMSDVFKLVQYFKNLDHFPQYSRVRKLFFPGEPPVSTVVEVSGMLPTPDILIEVEATAYLPLR